MPLMGMSLTKTNSISTINPTFTKTGLMVTASNTAITPREKGRYLKRQRSPPLALPVVKEDQDMSFLKSVKSKVDCWGGPRLALAKGNKSVSPRTKISENIKETYQTEEIMKTTLEENKENTVWQAVDECKSPDNYK